MTTTQALYRWADTLHVPVLFFPLPQTGSVSIQNDGGCWIGLDPGPQRTENERRVRLAHELGHCATGSFYNRWSPCDLRALHENRADRAAIARLVPPEELKQALDAGVTEVWDLAERFGVDVPFMEKALTLYRYGNLATELYFET